MLQKEHNFYQAALVDIPVPLTAILVANESPQSSQACRLNYKVAQSSPQLMTFFMQEMDRAGWRCFAQYAGEQEQLLIFEQPYRYCTISLRSSTKNQVFMTIITGNKEETVP